MLDDRLLFTVTDLKQFTYCQRVIFYERCLPHIRPRTFKMDAGRDTHEEEEKRAVRRSLSGYDVLSGKRFFNVRVISESLGLSGEIDEVVRTSDGEVFPVDYKLAKQASPHYKLQLAAYAMLLETAENVAVKRGYIYLIRTRQLVKVAITSTLRTQVETALTTMQQMIEQERMPGVAVNPNYCAACEFRRFCNDV